VRESNPFATRPFVYLCQGTLFHPERGRGASVPYTVGEVAALAAKALGVETPDFSVAPLGTAEAVP
jgi:hypothetical protein